MLQFLDIHHKLWNLVEKTNDSVCGCHILEDYPDSRDYYYDQQNSRQLSNDLLSIAYT